jgi:hypothetical protein
MWECGMESSISQEHPAAGPCGRSYLYIGYVQHTEYTDSLGNYQLVKTLIIIRKRMKKDTEKLSTYKVLKIAVSRMWKVRIKTVQVTI